MGTSHQLWLGLQTEYELQKAQDKGTVEYIEQNIQPLTVNGDVNEPRRNE